MAGWRMGLWAALVIATVAFFYAVRAILLPFVLAVLIAVVLDPTIRKLRMRGMPRGAAVWLVTLVFMGVVVGISAWLTPMVTHQIGTFRTTIERVGMTISTPDPNSNYFVKWNPVATVEAPAQLDVIDQALHQIEPQLKMANLPTTRRGLYDRYIAPNNKQISKGVQNFFNSFFGLVSALTSQIFLLVFTPIIVVWLLLDFEQIKKRAVTWIPPTIRATTVDLLNDIGAVFTSYLRGMTLTVLTYMGLAAVVLIVLRTPYPLLLAMLLGVIYLVPYIRVFIWVPLLFTVAALSGSSSWFFVQFPSSIIYGLFVVAAYFVFDICYDTFVTPQIIGRAVGLNPVVSMFVSFSGAALFGIPGMLLAYPTAGAVKVVLDRLLRITTSSAETLSLPAVPMRHRA